MLDQCLPSRRDIAATPLETRMAWHNGHDNISKEIIRGHSDAGSYGFGSGISAYIAISSRAALMLTPKRTRTPAPCQSEETAGAVRLRP